MRHLRPVDVVVDMDFPESGFFTDESMDGPHWDTLTVSRTFFGKPTRWWLVEQFRYGHVVLDGVPLDIPRHGENDRRQWRLIDVERAAHALAQTGYLPVDQLVRTIEIVRGIAESWGFIKAREIPTRIETRDPHRTEMHVVQEIEDLTDDLDGSPDAKPRSFALGDTQYRLDLTEAHWNDLVAAVGPFVKVARKDNRPAQTGQHVTRAEIREWARENGYRVASSGPLPRMVERAYHLRGQAS